MQRNNKWSIMIPIKTRQQAKKNNNNNILKQKAKNKKKKQEPDTEMKNRNEGR